MQLAVEGQVQSALQVTGAVTVVVGVVRQVQSASQVTGAVWVGKQQRVPIRSAAVIAAAAATTAAVAAARQDLAACSQCSCSTVRRRHAHLMIKIGI